MARKPADQLSPAYARRLARAEAKGLTRQQARGHRQGEHIVRKLGGARVLSPTQKRDAERLAAAVRGKRGAVRAAAAAEEARKARNRERARERHRRQVEHERWSGVLTDKDKRYARMIGRRWSNKIGLEPDAAAIRGVERMGRIGPERFRAWVKQNRAMFRQYREEVEEGSYASRGIGFLELLAAPDNEQDVSWYFYHSYT